MINDDFADMDRALDYIVNTAVVFEFRQELQAPCDYIRLMCNRSDIIADGRSLQKYYDGIDVCVNMAFCV